MLGNETWKFVLDMEAYAPTAPKKYFAMSKNSEQKFDVDISTFYVCTPSLSKTDIFYGLHKKTKMSR